MGPGWGVEGGEETDQISGVIRYGGWKIVGKMGFYKEVHRWAQEKV